MSNSWWEKQHLDGGTGELTGVHSNSDGVNKCYFNPAIAVPIYNLWEGLFELSDFFFFIFSLFCCVLFLVFQLILILCSQNVQVWFLNFSISVRVKQSF